MSERNLWKMFIPTHSNKGIEFLLEQHKEWVKQVRTIAPGLTVYRPKGRIIKTEITYSEEVIPLKVECAKEDIDKIINFTLDHYKLRNLKAYKLSSGIVEITRKVRRR